MALRQQLNLQGSTSVIQSKLSDQNTTEPLLFSNEIDHTAITYIKQLDDGGSSKVYLGSFNQEQVAIKKYELRPGSKRKADKIMLEEWNILRACFPTQYVIKPIGYCLKPPLVILEYMENGALDSYMEVTTLTWLQRVSIANDVALGLLRLLEAGYVHKDIKSGNILLTKDLRAKIIDFDLSSKIGSLASKKGRGTDDYMAPECITNELKSPQAADVYSFGVVLLEMAIGSDLFSDYRETIKASSDNYYHRYMKIQNLIEEHADEWPQKYSKLVRACLDIVPSRRPTMATVQSELNSLLEVMNKEAAHEKKSDEMARKKKHADAH